MHAASRQPLLDTVTCIREHCTIDAAGYRLEANAERTLKSPAEMAHLFRAWPEALVNTLEIAARCRFSLDELRHDYPEELTTEGRAPQEELEHLTWAGAAKRYPKDRYPNGIPDRSEEHTSELQSLMRISYDVFCLKKKNTEN